MNDSKSLAPRGPIAWIMLAIVAWAIVLAGGVLWYDYSKGRVDLLKVVVILVVTALFLGMWWLALRRRGAARTSSSRDAD